jgi:hypothetical protein
MQLTYQDVVEDLIYYMGGEASDSVLRDAKKAATEALREITAAHTWTYLYKQGRIETTQSYSDGTISYQASGGPNPFQVSLTGGTWPDWACHGVIRVGNINYEVERRISGTVVTLMRPQVPPCDFAGEAYGLFQVSYPLPDDFLAQDETFLSPENFGGLSFVHPREWLRESSQWGVLGNPVIFSIMADKHLHGRLSMYLAPFPTEQQAIEFLYKRHLCNLDVFRVSAGTVSTAAGYGNITALGANFLSTFCRKTVLRVSSDKKLLPTSELGSNPAAFESKIIAVPTSQQLVLQDPAPISLTNMPYTISSIVDVEHKMVQAYLRRAEYQLCVARRAKNKKEAYEDYRVALASAKSADYANMKPRTASPSMPYRRRLRDYPINLSQENLG